MTNAAEDVRHYLDYIREHGSDAYDVTDEEAQHLLEHDRDALFLRCSRIVPFVIQRHWPAILKHESYPDVLQEGNKGILMCFRSWKYGKGSSITTWAYQYAKRYVSLELDKVYNYDRAIITVPFEGLSEDEGPTALHWSDVAHDEPEGAGERSMQWHKEFDAVHNLLNTTQQMFLEFLRDGYSYREMGEMISKSHTYCSKQCEDLLAFVRSSLQIQKQS